MFNGSGKCRIKSSVSSLMSIVANGIYKWFLDKRPAIPHDTMIIFVWEFVPYVDVMVFISELILGNTKRVYAVV
jgi:hypothetical protein